MTEFQRASVAQGNKFEDAVGNILEITGVTILQTNWKDPASKEEVDVVAETKTGVRFWVEAKGSWQSGTNNNGLRRADTTKKAVASAWHLHHVHGNTRPPYILVTTDLPKPGSVSELEIEHALDAGLFTRVVSIDHLRETVTALGDDSLS